MPCCSLIPGSYVEIETWEDEEDDYLAALVSQNMLLNSEQVGSLRSSQNLRTRVNWSDVFVRRKIKYGVRFVNKESLRKITD